MKFKKIYILCPGGLKTGGPELLHQLAYQINEMASSKVAHIVYFGNTKTPVVKDYEKYLNNQWITEESIIDVSENLVIFPETALSYFDKFSNVKKYIWWLSVDNYLYSNSFTAALSEFGLITALHYYLNGTIRNRFDRIAEADLNLCQSYYAMSFLLDHGIKNVKILSDYINDMYINNSEKFLSYKRKNIVLYNPKKGYKYTKKLIKYSPDIQWIPLIGLSNKQVLDYLTSGKVYIDFGNHPGKDRFPREAAICGCCIITGKRGAASFKQDIFIPEQYKFNDNTDNIPKIIKKIRFLLKNYNEAINDFDNYRKKISNEKDEFKRECKKIFSIE